MHTISVNVTTGEVTQIEYTAQEQADWDTAGAAAILAAPALAAEATRIAAVEVSISGDTTIATLKAMTNAEFDTWWSANVTTLAQANGVLKRLARLVIRRVL